MNTITSALKNLTRRGQHNIQKVVCLALGLAVSAVLITELNYEQTFDTWFPCMGPYIYTPGAGDAQ